MNFSKTAQMCHVMMRFNFGKWNIQVILYNCGSTHSICYLYIVSPLGEYVKLQTLSNCQM